MIRRYRGLLGLSALLAVCLSVPSAPALAGGSDARGVFIPCAAGTAEKQASSGKAWLGVAVQELSDELREVLDVGDEFVGLLVAGVTDGSPADKAGIKHGDVIVSVSGREMETPDDLVEFIQSKKPGTEVVVAVVRDGKKHKMTVLLGKTSAKTSKDVEVEMPDSRSFPMEIMPPLRHLKLQVDRGYLGVNVLNLDEDLGGYFGVQKGVLVTEVLEGSAAEKAGMKAGDVITAVDGKKVADREELTGFLRKKDDGDKVDVSLLRKGKPMSLTVTLEQGPLWAWMEGIGDEGAKFKEEFVMPKVYSLKKDADLERRMEELSKELERLKERLEKLDEELGSR
jgi:predicted metalloprotease with PDZ domain